MNWKRFILGISLAGSCFVVSLVLILGVIVENNVVNIEPDERGVVLSLYEPTGYRPEVLTPGRHWIRPAERVVIYKISRQTYTTVSDAPGLDSIRAQARTGEELLVDVSAIYAIDPERVLDLHISWQDRYKDSLVRPLIRQTTRKIVTQYTTNEIKGNRPRVEQAIFAALEQEFARNYLILLEFKIINIQPYG